MSITPEQLNEWYEESKDDRAILVGSTVRALVAEVRRLTKERTEAQTLALEMWQRAEDWTGPRASSHYRSSVLSRLRAMTGAKL